MLRLRTDLPREERPAVAWAGAWFFLVMCGWSLLRPLREEMGIAGGVENLPWVFTATFLGTLATVPLLSLVVARFRARMVVPVAYHAFAGALVLFALLVQHSVQQALVARAFFVFVSIANLFLVSILWSLLADAFTTEQAARAFGLVAAGGSAGAVAGPLLARGLAGAGAPVMLLVAALLVEGGVACVGRLVRWSAVGGAGSLAHAEERPIGGGVLSGLPLLLRSRSLMLTAAIVVLYTSTSTFVYLEQARIVRDAIPSPVERTEYFASIDVAVNGLALLGQLFATGTLVARLGLGASLAALPVLTGAGLLALAASPTTWVLAVFQTARRSLHHALDRPAREMVFTSTGREEKYKSKSLIDTVLYRGSDAASGWAHAGLVAFGLPPPALLLAALPPCAAWLWAAVSLGRRHRALRPASSEEPEPCPSPVAT